jgi:hypothetical protein
LKKFEKIQTTAVIEGGFQNAEGGIRYKAQGPWPKIKK